jgi:DNA-binding MarR family transcriptional regulator
MDQASPGVVIDVAHKAIYGLATGAVAGRRPEQLVLGAVLSSPPSSIGEIAKGLGLAQSAVSSAVASLRERQLVLTEVDANDRRVTQVSAAPRLAAWAAAHLHVDAATVMAPLLADRPSQERRRVLDGLAILHDAFKRQEVLPGDKGRRLR